MRQGLYDGRLLTLFPRQLLNTAVSPTLLVKDKYSRLIENIIPNVNKAGSGAKRFGMGPIGDAAGSAILDTFEFIKSDGTVQSIVYCEDGSLRTFDQGTGNYTNIKTGLNVLGSVGCLPFNSKLIFFNGLDNNFSWDGVDCTDLGEFVSDNLAEDYTQNSTSQITLKPGTGRAAGDYPNGREIRVTFETEGVVAAVVASTSYDSGTNVLTINVVGTPFPTPSETVETVEYFDQPPPFSFMFAELDMLWGLSGGQLKAKQFRGADGMKVYHQDATNNENSWFFYEGTGANQEIRYINLANKVKKFDELVGISSIDQNICFHARRHLIVYTGLDPFTAGGFVWLKTIPVGTVHGKLIQPFPSDTLFMTPYGARSLRRVFETEGLEVNHDLGSDIDPTVQAKIKVLLSEDAAYKKARSFYSEVDGLYGFKLDDDGLLIYVLSEESKGWVLFTGYFADATGFCATSDGRLLISRGDQLYAYGNGADSEVGTVYADADEAIACVWWSPWITGTNGRWSNVGWQVILEDAAFAQFYVDRFIDYNSIIAVTTQFNVTSDGAKWDESMWDEAYFDGSPVNPFEEDKFLAEAFSFRLRHETTTGPLAVLAVRPIGR